MILAHNSTSKGKMQNTTKTYQISRNYTIWSLLRRMPGDQGIFLYLLACANHGNSGQILLQSACAGSSKRMSWMVPTSLRYTVNSHTKTLEVLVAAQNPMYNGASISCSSFHPPLLWVHPINCSLSRQEVPNSVARNVKKRCLV